MRKIRSSIPASIKTRIPALVFAMISAMAGAAWSQCAMHDVPALVPGGSDARLGLALRETALAAASGSLSEAEASAAFALGEHWELGFRLPFGILSIPAGTAAGLGDPSWQLAFRGRGFGDRGFLARRFGDRGFLGGVGGFVWGASGLISVPLGDAGNGLGADAYGAAGFLSAGWEGNGWTGGAFAGWHGMFASGGNPHAHAGGAVPLSHAYALAHPHARRELVYRLQWEGGPGRILGLAMDGAHPLGASMGATGTEFLEGEGSLRARFAGAAWKASFRFPLSPDRRLLFGLGLAANRDW